jgi:hypothetical protein
MEMNSKEYDRYTSRISQQNQSSQNRPVTAQDGYQQRSQAQALPPSQNPGQKRRPPQKMPKARAQALAHTLKRGLAISSIMGFGAFSGLVALHHVGSTSTTTTTATQAIAASSQTSKSITKQQGGNNFATSTTATATSTTRKKSTATATSTTRKKSTTTTTKSTTSSATATPVSRTSTS